MRFKVIGAACTAVAIAAMSACGSDDSDRDGNSPAKPGATAPAAPSYPDAQRFLAQVTAGGSPGALAEVNGSLGRTLLTSGVADTGTKAPMAAGRFRIGSVTKTFTATVVLQLVGEGKIALDAPIETYLPGLIKGKGNDGHDITVRQLLQQTTGLPDYLDYLTPTEILKNPLAHHEAGDLLKLALTHERQFAPGTAWKYSNTNYIVAGMLIEKVTGQPYGKEIERRIIAPLGLRDTSVPADEPSVTGASSRGYVSPGGDKIVDVSEFNPTIASSAGAMISSGTDLNVFFEALLKGRLLRPAELQAMMTTRSTGDSSGRAYGLGLESRSLSCGGVYWGNEGDIFGSTTKSGLTTDGRQVTVMANVNPGGGKAQDADMRGVISSVLCMAPAATPSR
jgi:D-alanyl-D-alanine carboxypeptidase